VASSVGRTTRTRLTRPTGPQSPTGGAPAQRGLPLATGQLLILAARAHRARLARVLTEVGLSAGQEALLREVACADGITLSALAARLRVQPPTVTNMVARMERAGFVRRDQDSRDGRVKLLRLAPRGQSIHRVVERRCRAAEGETVAVLSMAERAELAHLLRKLVGDPGGHALV
jgi:MarR family transcriptional regulator, organic hydroperoxide resistance regulator